MGLGEWSGRLCWTALLLAVAALDASGGQAASSDTSFAIIDRVPRVLVLYPYDERIAATTAAGEALRSRLLEATNGKIDLFSEFLDLSRFPEGGHVPRMARYLGEKYAARRPDVVVALGKESASFVTANRSMIAPGAKIVAAGFGTATAEKIDLPDDVVGAFATFDILKTAEMARSLQPDARHLYIVGGSSDFDRGWLTTARAALREFSKSYETTYLEDLTIDEFVERASRVPSDSIILALTVFTDRAGRNFIPRDAIRQIAATASAPVYGPYQTYIDYGVVGGNTVTFEALGRTVGDLVIDAIAGKTVSDIEAPQTYLADARQLQRWGLAEKDLPPGTVQMHRERSVWQEHWVVLVAGSGLVLAQATIISVLLLERRRRRDAERSSRLHLLEAVHLNQSATAGALSSSIAHELNQPLSAIRNNAEAASVLLRSESPDHELIQQILLDIQEDDQRAGDIISRMRGLLKKRSEIDWQEFDLNDVTSSAIHIIHGEAERRGITLTSNQLPGELPVRADKVHVQQVILNLATNAMDAMLEAVPAGRTLTFATGLANEKVELRVSDTGDGIPAERLIRIFEPFYTTKQAGTGLGLSIARAIVETYGGTICADNRPEGGAVFRMILPLAHAEERSR
ncbi:sensor histidine kinase [Rhizobium hidalgonense]|uniref:histidine kinase n=1 Tax=Rhizobium hidalgonense TaxID=1538159 RepID=A0A2A6KEY2_9HYPH|nr:sensor histidine kinase [Rhizobium hidalgonense]EJC77974.1 histidine kinase [Rhizobium leguminosarum bv. trifolii WSM2012]MDR9772771.1 sensor histidine kinase [Rhizobium hidalgonense]MDR9806853.1 sensor histidine kinase [Rhizobium hidalgonense]MDR9812894.1 sensor histidine kinase [Rhizobium hidalgonense]MDR9820231.1 sensor histidine kinase [Rhizobium hidalgonense]